MFNHRTLIRVIYIAILTLLFVVTFHLLLVVESQVTFFKKAPIATTPATEYPDPFPVSVNVSYEIILEQDKLNLSNTEISLQHNLLNQAAG